MITTSIAKYNIPFTYKVSSKLKCAKTSRATIVPLQDYYSVHGENAIFIAKSFYKTTAVVKTMGSSSNNLQGMPLTRKSPPGAQLLMRTLGRMKCQDRLMLTDQRNVCRCDLKSKSV